MLPHQKIWTQAQINQFTYLTVSFHRAHFATCISFFSSSIFCYLYQFSSSEDILFLFLLPVSVSFYREHFATFISFFSSRTFCYLYQFLFIENILLPASVSFHQAHFATCISLFSSGTFCYLYQFLFIENIGCLLCGITRFSESVKKIQTMNKESV